MHRFKLMVFASAVLCACCYCYPVYALRLPDKLFSLPSQQGVELFEQARVKQDYWQLSQYYVPQANLAYCGIASMVMLLNAYAIVPQRPGVYKHYPWMTQANVFSPAVTQILSASDVQHHGVTLAQLAEMLATYGLHARTIYADTLSVQQFRDTVLTQLSKKHAYVLVNYDRKVLQQVGGGHITPIVAYHAATDRFLLLDVARYKYLDTWVPVQDLWQAMHTRDHSSGLFRGILLVNKR